MKLWREGIENHGLTCELLSRVEEYIKEKGAKEQECVPEGLQTMDISGLNLSFPYINVPHHVPLHPEAENVDGLSLSSDSDSYELLDLENLMEERDLSLTSISPNASDEGNLKDWLTKNAPGFSEASFAEVLKALKQADEGGVGALDTIDFDQLKRQLQLEKPKSYQIIGDNVDLYVKVKHMASERQNKSIHWFAMNAVQDRVTGEHAAADQPIKPVLKMENVEFLPSVHDNHDLLHDFIPLFARVLVEKIPAFRCFKSVVVRHIPHKYTSQMKEKSTQVLCTVH